MAKWGEGDPRWIVEERADATNVNNWHWTEKNASIWSKEKLKQLFEGLVIEDECYFCEINELTKLEGEASASNRKGKLIFFYEWDITADWKGKMKTSNTSYKGKIEFLNLSDENDADEIDITASTSIKEDEAYQIKEFMRIKGQDKVREQVAIYIRLLKEEFSAGMILPTKQPEKAKSTITETVNTAKKELNKAVTTSKDKQVGVKIKCKTLTDKCEFKCRASELYRVFTDPGMVRAFTQTDCQIEAVTGGNFNMFGGNISGEFTQLVLDEKICMRWRFKSWADGHYSIATLSLNQKDDCTMLDLNQTGVPESDFERTKEGWQRYYWYSIKNTFGFGANLF